MSEAKKIAEKLTKVQRRYLRRAGRGQSVAETQARELAAAVKGELLTQSAGGTRKSVTQFRQCVNFPTPPPRRIAMKREEMDALIEVFAPWVESDMTQDVLCFSKPKLRELLALARLGASAAEPTEEEVKAITRKYRTRSA